MSLLHTDSFLNTVEISSIRPDFFKSTNEYDRF